MAVPQWTPRDSHPGHGSQQGFSTSGRLPLTQAHPSRHCSKHSLAKNRILEIPARNPASENGIIDNALVGQRFRLKFTSTGTSGVSHSGEKSDLNSSFMWLHIC